eukprot:TRINITY_DN13839_c0_g2_i2.p2 TRINITY_DN13839_c0_g2~~TRINITY_DN13839_c0_g2_i2.p2  ORF type:complete len:100 (+),score=46.41 TRINITY_DN13839_c0_g2_i2:84-383(+)
MDQLERELINMMDQSEREERERHDQELFADDPVFREAVEGIAKVKDAALTKIARMRGKLRTVKQRLNDKEQENQRLTLRLQAAEEELARLRQRGNDTLN